MHKTTGYQPIGSRGFTLMEILVVLVLMSLVLGISVVYFAGSLPNAKQKAAAREMAATIKYAKKLAGIRNEKQILNFDLDAGHYGIKGREIKSLPRETKLVIYASPVNADPVINGQYQIVCEAAGTSDWDRIVLVRGDRMIQIMADPIRTAFIVLEAQEEHRE